MISLILLENSLPRKVKKQMLSLYTSQVARQVGTPVSVARSD